jgi:hypothetical protein
MTKIALTLLIFNASSIMQTLSFSYRMLNAVNHYNIFLQTGNARCARQKLCNSRQKYGVTTNDYLNLMTG